MNKKDFLDRVEKTETCWNWKRYIKPNGYGTITEHAHRVSYELFIGEIPSGLTIHHICGNTKCVNPKHLQIMTLQENLKLSNGIGAQNSRKTHCKRGHLLKGKNLRKRKDGSRICRKCDNPAQRRRYHERKKSINIIL